MKHAKMMVFAFLFSFSFFSWADSHLTMNDLKVLFEKKEYGEILESARKVPPAQRTQEWNEIYGQAAAFKIESLIEKGQGSYAYQIGEEIERTSPSVGDTPEFNTAMAKAAFSRDPKGLAIVYLSKSLKANDPQCKTENVKQAVVTALTKYSDAKTVAAAQKVAFNLCASELSSEWIAEMIASEKGLKNSCSDLLKSGQLQGVALVKCKKNK